MTPPRLAVVACVAALAGTPATSAPQVQERPSVMPETASADTSPDNAGTGSLATGAPAMPTDPTRMPSVTWPVLLDSLPVYMAVGVDTAAAQSEAARVRDILVGLLRRPDLDVAMRLQERDGNGVVVVDSVAVLVLTALNRVDREASPLANALVLHDGLLRARAEPGSSWDEEELLLRLLLGVIYPVSLLVVLRLTRFGLRKWERDWRRTVLRTLERHGRRRGLDESRQLARRVVNVLTGIERTVVYSTVLVAISFTWFALFPQTRPLAVALLRHVIGPLLSLLGGTVRGGLLLAYSLAVIFGAVRVTGALSRRRASSGTLLGDPLVSLPLRVAVWVVALFLVLLPYPGAPRLIGVGILLLVLLGAVVALRPLIEEIAAGIYVNGHYDLRLGRELSIDGVPGVVVAARLAHLEVACGQETHSIPYSRILKADVCIGSDGIGLAGLSTRAQGDS